MYSLEISESFMVRSAFFLRRSMSYYCCSGDRSIVVYLTIVAFVVFVAVDCPLSLAVSAAGLGVAATGCGVIASISGASTDWTDLTDEVSLPSSPTTASSEPDDAASSTFFSSSSATAGPSLAAPVVSTTFSSSFFSSSSGAVSLASGGVNFSGSSRILTAVTGGSSLILYSPIFGSIPFSSS